MAAHTAHAREEAPTGARLDPQAERRQLSVLFCDLVGSTRISEQLDPEELRELVRNYQSTCFAPIERFGGSIAQYLGDGILAYFGFPHAHEDDARRAILAALGILAEVGRMRPTWQQRYGFDISVRIGIHTGLVVTGQIGAGARSERLAVGQTPNLAARLQSIAQPDSIVVSDTVKRLTEDHFEFESLGHQDIRGISARIEAFHVLREAGLGNRFRARAERRSRPIVGRRTELSELAARSDQALSGTPQLVLVEGEPGIGKSRLVDAFREWAQARGFRFWECECAAYHQTTGFFPIISLTRDLFELGRGEIPETKLARFRRIVGRWTKDPASPELLANLLHLSNRSELPSRSTTSRQRLLELLSLLVEQAAEHRPLILAIEDAHWMDPSTAEWLDHLSERSRLRPGRWMVVLTSRPSFKPAWLGQPNAARLSLDRLSASDAAELVRGVCSDRIRAGILDGILDKAGGVPIYLEELTKLLLEGGRLDGSEERIDPLPGHAAIPSTLHDSLMARLDAAGSAKELAQIGSVLGRDFLRRMLKALSGRDDVALERELARLEHAELIQRTPDTLEPSFVFKHALIRDAAYGSLLRSRRDGYHKRTAEILLEEFPEIAEAQPELVAYHLSEAGDAESAVSHWLLAGKRAVAYFENQEALHHLRRGLELLKRHPGDAETRARLELELQLALGSASMAALGYTATEVGAAYKRALELSVAVEDSPAGAFLPTIGLWMYHVVRAELGLALPLAERLLCLADAVAESDAATGDAAHVSAQFARGFTAFFAGDFECAKRFLERALQFDGLGGFDRTSPTGDDHEIHARVFLGWTLYNMGYDSAALEHVEAAEALARERGHPYGIVFASSVAGNVYDLCGQPERALESAERAISKARDQGFAFLLATSTFVHASAQLTLSHRAGATADRTSDAGFQILAACQQGLRARSAGMMQTYLISRIVEHYVARDSPVPKEFADALELAIAEGEERAWRAECLRLRAELERRAAGPDRDRASGRAERSLESALQIAREQGTARFEQRALASLARLLMDREQRECAQSVLRQHLAVSRNSEREDTAERQTLVRLLEDATGRSTTPAVVAVGD